MKKSNHPFLLCALIIFSFVSGTYSQTNVSNGIFLKSVQMDITSAFVFNRLSIYGDVDIYKRGPGLNSYGFQIGADLTHMLGLVKIVEGFPVRNLFIGLRASSALNDFPVNIHLSYVNGISLSKGTPDRSGNFIKMGFDVNKYFWANKLGMRFKLDLPLYTLSGTSNGFYVGLGFVIGYLRY